MRMGLSGGLRVSGAFLPFPSARTLKLAMEKYLPQRGEEVGAKIMPSGGHWGKGGAGQQEQDTPPPPAPLQGCSGATAPKPVPQLRCGCVGRVTPAVGRGGTQYTATPHNLPRWGGEGVFRGFCCCCFRFFSFYKNRGFGSISARSRHGLRQPRPSLPLAPSLLPQLCSFAPLQNFPTQRKETNRK